MKFEPLHWGSVCGDTQNLNENKSKNESKTFLILNFYNSEIKIFLKFRNREVLKTKCYKKYPKSERNQIPNHFRHQIFTIPILILFYTYFINTESDTIQKKKSFGTVKFWNQSVTLCWKWSELRPSLIVIPLKPKMQTAVTRMNMIMMEKNIQILCWLS